MTVVRNVFGIRCFIILTTGIVAAACGRGPATERSPAPAPRAEPSAVARLVAGLGQHDHPITTSNPQAQQFFDQGFSLVFAFNHEEAVEW